MSEQKRGQNLKIVWAKKTKVGFWSEDIGPAAFEALQRVELGGRLSLKSVPCKDKSGKEFEGFVFEYINKETVDRLKANKPQRPVYRDDQDDL